MANKDTKLDKVTKQLQAVLAERYESQSAILRQGDRIVIPEFMSWRDAAEAILSHEKKMEEEVQTLCEFDCHPHDGLVALYNAIKKTYGTLLGAESYSWFGKVPGKTYTVPISFSETLTVPIGDAEIPGLPVTMQIHPVFADSEDSDTDGKLAVVFNYRRKYEPLVKEIEQLTKDELRDHSIFRGKAIDSKFNFLDVETFDESRVVYSEHERRQIEANILSPIRNSKAWEASGSALRRGVLMEGDYGTGKTLTARLTGKVCAENGWTFINVLPGDDILRALRFAKKYEPACVFFEDIDAETEGPRDEHINGILNTIDGLLSKDSKLITVLTTNHIERVSRGMLRPGRLDSIIHMGSLDQAAVVKLIEVSATDKDGNSLLAGKLDAEEIFATAKGYVPAFVVESVTKAKAYALSRNPEGPLTITNSDIVEALHELRPQFDLMLSEQKVDAPTIDTAMKDMVNGAVSLQTKPIKEAVEKITRAIG